jgi:hypothetical protein
MADKQQFNQVLQDLKKKNEERVVNIWIPSLNKGVDFKHLTLDQQKALIKSSIKENLLKLDFSRNIYDVLLQNIVDKSVDVEKLNIVDMISIGIGYRATDIGEDYGFYVEEKFFPVDLNELCKKIRTTDYSDTFKPSTIISEGYHVTIKVPTIKADKQMNDHLFSKYDNIPEDTEEVKEMLADVYICEAAKYISQIDVVSEGDDPDNPPMQIDFTTLTAEQRLDVINEIPLTVLNKLVTVSDKVQEIESKILDVDLDGETTTIEINSAFFT